MPAGRAFMILRSAGVVAPDGEREFSFTANQQISVTLRADAFSSVEVAGYMQTAPRESRINNTTYLSLSSGAMREVLIRSAACSRMWIARLGRGSIELDKETHRPERCDLVTHRRFDDAEHVRREQGAFLGRFENVVLQRPLSDVDHPPTRRAW